MNNSWYITGGRLLDPSTGRDETGDLFVSDGVITELPSSLPPGCQTIEADGLVVAPGLIDLHVHLREPGGEEAETIRTGGDAALRGGFTTIVAMPNTTPPLDSSESVAMVKSRSLECMGPRVLPAGCITAGRSGKALSSMAAMVDAGAVAFTDDGSTVEDEGLLRQACDLAARLGVPVMDHALDSQMAGEGVMHEGAVSAKLGLPGIPSHAETSVVERDVSVARDTGASLHVQHVSAAASLGIVADAVSDGVRVSCEVTPHHIALADVDITGQDTAFKVNPPIGSVEDRDAIREAVSGGIVNAFATDHAPHSAASKARSFTEAPFGAIGLETAVGISYSVMVKSGAMGLMPWLKMWTTGPARILNLLEPSLNPGSIADIVLLDLESEWTIDSSAFASKSCNTPFDGSSVTGRARCTFCGGNLRWDGR